MNFAELESQVKSYKGTGGNIRIILYSHDTLGLGHIKRNLKIARAIKSKYPEMSILLLTGSLQSSGFELPPGTDFVKLPSVKKTGADRYESRFSDISFDQSLNMRKAIILDVVKEYAPDFFVVDHSPLGMNKEIVPAMEWLADKNPGCIKILGLRDILDDPQMVRESWNKNGVYEALEIFYDLILIYGTSDIFNPVQNYELNNKVKEKTGFIGYIAEPVNQRNGDMQKSYFSENKNKLVVITIGGGEWMGEIIIGNFLKLLEAHQNDIKFDSVILTGPFIPDKLWSSFQKASEGLQTKIIKFVPQIRPYIEASDLVVATGGYNTITDILAYGGRALVIPRIKYRNEQLIRARCLSDLGLINYMHPDKITPDSLYQNIENNLNDAGKPLTKARMEKLLNLNGANNFVSIMGKLIPPSTKNRINA